MPVTKQDHRNENSGRAEWEKQHDAKPKNPKPQQQGGQHVSEHDGDPTKKKTGEF